MHSNLVNIIMILCAFEQYLVFTSDVKLLQMEENLLYSHLKTPADMDLYYQKLLDSNGIDDPTRLHRIVTEDDVRQLNLEQKVCK